MGGVGRRIEWPALLVDGCVAACSERTTYDGAVRATGSTTYARDGWMDGLIDFTYAEIRAFIMIAAPAATSISSFT